MASNRTQNAVTQQLKAFGDCNFEIGVLSQKGMLRRSFDRAKVLDSIAWLKMMNRRGCDIFIRPLERVGWVLLDDLGQTTVDNMNQGGYAPALTVQTSPGNYQAWIRLIENREKKQLPMKLLSDAAVSLAEFFDADPRAADWRHMGRLAGFTNRKPKYVINGRSPFVLLHGHSGRVASQGRNLLLILKEYPLKKEYKPYDYQRNSLPCSYASYFSEIFSINHHQSWVKNPDLSRVDFMIAKKMYQEGSEPKLIWQTLRQSPHLSTRKSGHIDDYLQRTIAAVVGSTLFPAFSQK